MQDGQTENEDFKDEDDSIKSESGDVKTDHDSTNGGADMQGIKSEIKAEMEEGVDAQIKDEMQDK